MITFGKLFYKNLQAVGNQGITIDLSRSPTTMLSGSNGSGKSTVLEAISYGLFGKPMKKVVLGGLINTTNKKNLLVEINFTKNGVNYKIIRGQKPNKLEFYIDDELVDQSAASKDYQAKIEYVLGMDFKLFTQTIVLNKEKYVPFMEQTAPERRKIVEDVLDISVFSVMNDIVKEEAKAVWNDHNDVSYSRQKLQERIVGQDRLIAEAESNSQGLVDSILQEISDAEQELGSLNAKVPDLEAQVQALTDLESVETKKKKVVKEFETIGIQFQSKITTINEQLSFYTKNSNCPTCSQEIAADLKQLKEKECQDKVDEIKTHSTNMIGEYQKVKDDLAEIQRQISELGDARTNLTLTKSDIRRVEAQLSSLNMKLEKAQQESKAAQFIKEKQETERELSELDTKLAQIAEKSEAYDLCKLLLKDDGIKSAIVKDYIDFINIRVNEYLSAMDFHIALTLDENFNEKVGAVNREGFTHDNLSTGQKTRVSLAVWLALLEVASIKNSVVTNLLMLDEILENLDGEGVNSFMKLVKEKLPHKNVFVITQRSEEFSEHFRSEVRFKLNEGFTEIV